jgi:hypothetical protein
VAFFDGSIRHMKLGLASFVLSPSLLKKEIGQIMAHIKTFYRTKLAVGLT